MAEFQHPLPLYQKPPSPPQGEERVLFKDGREMFVGTDDAI
jgi:hypothetical protein